MLWKLMAIVLNTKIVNKKKLCLSWCLLIALREHHSPQHPSAIHVLVLTTDLKVLCAEDRMENKNRGGIKQHCSKLAKLMNYPF